MKMHFSLTISGEDSIEKKLQESINSNPTLHIDLVRAFGQSIMLALRLNESDKIAVSSFKAGIIEENEKENKECVEN